MLSLSSAALAFAPGLTAHPGATLLPHLARAARGPAMLLDHGVTQLLADAASTGAIMMPPAEASADAAAAAAAAADEPGIFGLLFVKPFEFAICTIHDTLKGAGVQEAFGPSIILFTLLLKGLTFPLNKQQIESTTKMQAIQPAAKALQEKYRNKDPARLNMEIQKLYSENQVNPLAGCLPSLAQIPIFIGLYRSVLALAKEDKLEESFLWLPSLEGPVADYTQGSGWLFGNAEQGYNWDGLTPPLGWHDTLAYLTLPVILVASQYVSTALLTPKSDDPAQQQTQAILKFLPLMLGWFSLSVPSGLGLYWITNNVVTTLTNVLLKKSINADMELAGGVGAASSPPPSPAAFEPKPQGFGGGPPREVVTRMEGDGTKVTISPPGASKRAERRQAAKAAAAAETVGAVGGAVTAEATVVDVEAASPEAAAASSVVDAGVEAAAPKPAKKKKAAKKKKKKN